MMMTQRAVGRFLQLLAFQKLDAAHTRRRPQVIHDRKRFVKSLRRDDVFVSYAFIFERWRRAVAMKPNVMFSRNLSELVIKRHCRSFLRLKTPHPTLSSFKEERRQNLSN